MSGLVVDKNKADRSRKEAPLTRLIFIILVVVFDIGAFWFIRSAVNLGFTQLVICLLYTSPSPRD